MLTQACSDCNTMKHDYSSQDFIQICRYSLARLPVSACLSLLQHTSAYVSGLHTDLPALARSLACVSMPQLTPAYVSIRQRTSYRFAGTRSLALSLARSQSEIHRALAFVSVSVSVSVVCLRLCQGCVCAFVWCLHVFVMPVYASVFHVIGRDNFGAKPCPHHCLNPSNDLGREVAIPALLAHSCNCVAT